MKAALKTTPQPESFEPAKSGSAQGEVAAVQPVLGISQRTRTGPKKKKDLGTPGMLRLCKHDVPDPVCSVQFVTSYVSFLSQAMSLASS